MRAYAAYGGIDPETYFAIGDAGKMLTRIDAYIAGGVSKFILRPLGFGDADMMAQTERLIAEVLPMAPARWPKPPENQ
jgi:hypothetical protein